MKVHLLFEQSGTFKNEFKKLGYEAFDYDILNDFNETDYIIDLFNEIEKGYNHEPSIFDNISQEDLIMAFFPCTRFEAQSLLLFRGDNSGMKKWSEEIKLKYDLMLHRELHLLYEKITKLSLIAINRNLKLIIENPYSNQSYLIRYWALKPSLIDEDRRDMGDFYKKPTMYYFINLEPAFNFCFESLISREKKTIVETQNKVERSMIAKEYANRFIREFILEEQ